MNRAVFLDRDGVLLDHGGLIISGVRKQLIRLKNEGYLLIVVTNQPDIGSMKIREADVIRVHSGMYQALGGIITDLHICPHTKEDNCKCMKPEPGMLREAAEAHDIDLERSWMVGDRWRDVGAGHNAGCKTVLIGTGYGELFPIRPMHRAADMEHAVDIILEVV